MTGFRYVTPVEVRFRDCDPIGHVHNAVFHKSVPMPRAIREALSTFEGRELS